MPLAATIARRLRSSVTRRLSTLKQRVTGGPVPEASGRSSRVETSDAVAAPVQEAPVEVTPVEVAPVEVVAATETAVEPVTGPAMTREAVEVLFEDMVRPALQMDGGDITLVRVERDEVFVELRGACQTCPSAIVTMQDGIERLLREEFPTFLRLVRVGAGAERHHDHDHDDYGA